MLIIIDNLLDASDLATLRSWLSEASFEDGRATAGGAARLVKNNNQVNDEDPKLDEMARLIEKRLWRDGLFMAAAQPKEILEPLFSRYTPGMGYGTHMDNALMQDVRVDMSITVFLSEPSDYDGGELVIDFPTGERTIKLAAGSAVLYPTSALHRVAEVTRGTRLAAVTWIRSLVRDAAKREMLLDLKQARQALSERKQPDLQVAIDLVSKTYTNLLRHWMED